MSIAAESAAGADAQHSTGWAAQPRRYYRKSPCLRALDPKIFSTGEAGPSLNKVVEYCERLSTPHSPLLQHVQQDTIAKFTDAHKMVSSLQGQMLSNLAFLRGATKVLEIGTFTGYSALCFAQGMLEGRASRRDKLQNQNQPLKLVCCEKDEKAIAIAEKWFKEASALSTGHALLQAMHWRGE